MRIWKYIYGFGSKCDWNNYEDQGVNLKVGIGSKGKIRFYDPGLPIYGLWKGFIKR